MPPKLPIEPEWSRQATVVSASRRWVQLLSSDGSSIQARSRSKALEAVVGDKVLFEGDEGHAVVTEVLPNKNCLSRSYRDSTQRLAANLDQLFVVTAGGTLFNPYFLDRAMAVAAAEFIPCTLVVNKADLGFEDIRAAIEVYKAADVSVLYTSAVSGSGMIELQEAIRQPALEIVALCGVSGVGKSTLLNTIIPGIAARTGLVSERTGQGRQTTSQAFGYVYEREPAPRLLIIDLPGLQSFGITHLSKQQVADAFPEIVRLRVGCEFGNCSHISEQKCAVQEAVETGQFAFSRYESYAKMIVEIEDAAPY